MKTILFSAFFTCLLFSAVGQARQQAAAEAVLSEVQKSFAPDKRVTVWDFKTSVSGKTLHIHGVTDQPEVEATLRRRLDEAGIEAQISLSILPDAALGAHIFGIVKVSVANIRSEPRHSAELATQAPLGTPIKLLRQQGDWYQIQTPDRYIGWLENGGFAPKTASEMEAWRQSERLIFLDDYALCFAAPDVSTPVSDLSMGAIVAWNAASGRIVLPDGRTALLPSGIWMPLDTWKHRSTLNADSVLMTAARFSGRPYLWGGTSGKGMDCSGFTKTVYFLLGQIIPRDASQQVFAGEQVDWKNDFFQLLPGDFLFFGNYRPDGTRRITHVGIYTGNGRFIHSGSDNGSIREQSLRQGDADFQDHRLQSLMEARRLRPGSREVQPVRNSAWYFQSF